MNFSHTVLRGQITTEVQAVNAVPVRYNSQDAPWFAGDQSSAEPGAYRPSYELGGFPPAMNGQLATCPWG